MVESRVLEAVQRVGASGRYILGPEVDQFEKAIAEFLGVGHAVGVGNGMDALEIALRCLDLRAGEKVLTHTLFRLRHQLGHRPRRRRAGLRGCR